MLGLAVVIDPVAQHLESAADSEDDGTVAVCGGNRPVEAALA